jgi:hypothetical protein
MIIYQYYQLVELATTRLTCNLPIQNQSSNFEIQQILQENYEKMDAAFIKANVAEFNSYFSQKYLRIEAEQQLTLRKRNPFYLDFSSPASIGTFGTNLRWISRKTTIKSVVLKSDFAEVLVLQHDVMAIANTFTIDKTARHIWINTPQGWRLDQQTTLSTKRSSGAE